MKFPNHAEISAFTTRAFARSAMCISCLILFTLSACDDSETPANSNVDQLNENLLGLLRSAAPNNSADYFLMPADGDLAAIPQDPKNPLTAAKVALGKLLYHETILLTGPKRTEGLGTSSCAACHHAEAGFQAGVAQGIGEGGSGAFASRLPNLDYEDADLDIQPIRSPTAMNGAWQEVMLWNGQFGAVGPNAGTNSQWTEGTPKAVNALGYHGLETQAIAGLTVHRMGADFTVVQNNATYVDLFDEAFPGQEINAETAGLAIAAYERTLLSNEAPFQRWLAGDRNAMSETELRGATVFFSDKANCVSCHTGPALNSMSFHALGMKDLGGIGVYGDGPDMATKYGRGGFTDDPSDYYKFKTPQLYNLADSRFYGHGSSLQAIRDVIEYKNDAVAENASVPTSQLAQEFQPLGLSEQEIDDMTAFLTTALRDPNLARFVPTSLPSGACFPFNDPVSKEQMGCD